MTKPLLCLCLACLAAGCAGPSVKQIAAINNLATNMMAGNATFSLRIPSARGPIILNRANPIVGFTATVGSDGAITSVMPEKFQVTFQQPKPPEPKP